MFGKGKINITVSKTHYYPGDNISGSIALNLKKPVKAREVSISLGREQKIRRTSTTGNGGRSTSTERHRIYDFKQNLDNEREYSQGQEYNFEIKIPADILSMKTQIPEIEGKLGQGIKFMQVAATMAGVIPLQQTKWYLQAMLDVPGGLDTNRKADITIG